ncbi:hypothetical protein GCM10010306_099780 [Streptomyces umbrinus]|nr:hypothetical protein GCM10010306_099780 [Streptomyces umbrinus]
MAPAPARGRWSPEHNTSMVMLCYGCADRQSTRGPRRPGRFAETGLRHERPLGRATATTPTRRHGRVVYESSQFRAGIRAPAVGKVDEIHNVSQITRAGSEVSATLKYSSRIPATFVYAGINLDTSELLAGTRGAQIAGRFTLVPTRPFPYGDEWKGLVATMEETLLLHNHPPGSLVRLDRYLHNRADGMIGALSHAIRGAAIDAILNGTECVTKQSLDAIPLDHAAESSAKPLRKAARR